MRILLLALVALSACGTHLTSRGAEVQLAKRTPKSPCVELEAVSSGQVDSPDDAKITLRNVAARMGAEVVVLDGLEAEPTYYPLTKILTTQFIATGRAYECDAVLASAAPH